MNAQRQRRFKSAHNRAKKQTENNKLWDSNCITPGTEFMFDLNFELKHFIQHKINTDPEWKNLKVVLSGPEVNKRNNDYSQFFLRFQVRENIKLQSLYVLIKIYLIMILIRGNKILGKF
jgi:5'-3' exoribonuclease 1